MEASDPLPTEKLSKRAQKKLKKRQEWLDHRQERRALEKAKRKAKIEQRKAQDPNLPSYTSSRKSIKKTYEDKSKSSIQVVFDMSFGDLMNQKDRGKCLKQVLHCYSLNRRLDHPLNLHLTSFDGVMKEEMGQRHKGYENWKGIQFHQDPHQSVFSKEQIVYLTSESENVIDLQADKAYVIGALVDHNLHKGLCFKRAKEAGLAHARLPIDESIKLKTRKVLAIDHVFQILGSVVSQQKSWAEAFMTILPSRKGAELKLEEKTALKCREDLVSEDPAVSQCINMNASENDPNVIEEDN